MMPPQEARCLRRILQMKVHQCSLFRVLGLDGRNRGLSSCVANLHQAYAVTTADRREWPQKPSSRLSEGDLCTPCIWTSQNAPSTQLAEYRDLHARVIDPPQEEVLSSLLKACILCPR